MKRRMTGALFALFVFAGMAGAGEIKPFSQAEFDRLTQAGQSVVVPMSGALQQRFALLTAGIGKAGSNLLSRVQLDGLMGQFVVGLLLGLVWSPCVGPTLGAAIVMAGQGANLAQAASMMGVFGIGAALPLVALAFVSRSAMSRTRSKLLHAGKAGKTLLGAVMVVFHGTKRRPSRQEDVAGVLGVRA